MKKLFMMSASLILCFCYVNTVFSRPVLSTYGNGGPTFLELLDQAKKDAAARRKRRAEEFKAWLKDMLDYEMEITAADVHNKALEMSDGDRIEASYLKFAPNEAIAASHNRRVRRLQRQRSLQK